MKEKRSKKFIFYTLLIISALVTFFPIFYAISVSFMSEGDVRARKLWPSDFTFSNYGSAFEQMPLLHYLKNSFIVSSVVMIGQLVLSSLAAYTFAFLQFRGRNVLFFIIISTMLIPWEATMIPNFLMVQGLGWTNSYAGLTIPFFATAFGIFLLRQHFLTVPYELREASLIEGLGHFGFLTRVVVPYCKTSFITLGVYSFLTTWNMYLWPLLVTSDDSARTVQIGMKQLRSQEVATDWGGVMAGATIIVIPTLILLFLGQKQLQQGLTKGAIK